MASTQHLVPSANNPQLLTRLLEMVARGIRSTRGLQEALSVEPRTVQYYARAAEWLGLLDTTGESALTHLGLQYVYAGRRRAQVYATAVWANPLAATLLAAGGGDRLLSRGEIESVLAEVEPELAPATLKRRASAVRGLIAPAVGRPSLRPRQTPDRQLTLPLTLAPATAPVPDLRERARSEQDPEVYQYLWVSLLQYGELSLGQLRALLDRAGAREAPIGGYVDLALSRGDAQRVEERLVSTREGAGRRALSESVGSVILSDPGYRSHLATAQRVAQGPAAPGEARRVAEIQRDRAARRYRSWDRRLLGHPLRPEALSADLERVLLDRSLDAFPLAQRSAPDLVAVEEPWLDVADQPGLALAIPPYLTQLQGGLAAVNRVLRTARTRTDVEVPDLGYRPSVYHGGILHPGEPLPRSVPDARSLRLRVLMHAPFPGMLAALLLLSRYRPDLGVHRDGRGWSVRRGRLRIGPLLGVIDDFAAARGQVVCRHPAAMSGGELVGVLESLGISVVLGGQALLEERFFLQLRGQPEEMEIHGRLQPLAESWESWLAERGPPEAD